MKIRNVILGVAGLMGSILLQAQEKKDSVLRFSLAEAKLYGLENSPVVKNAVLDLEAAKKKIWETTAIGLPQAKATMSASYMISTPGFYAQFFKPTLGQAYQKTAEPHTQSDSVAFVNNQFNKMINDMRFSGTFDVQVSQLIFSGAYIVGLQTAKVYKSLSEIGISKSKNDLIESLSNSYYLVLIAQENKQITDSTLKNMNKMYQQIQAIQKQGLIEETDVDQLSITVSNVQSAADMLERSVEIAKNMLKYEMGIPVERNIELTDSLTTLLGNQYIELAMLNNFIVENYADYKLLDTQAKLMKLNVRLQQSTFLPDVAGFYQHEELLNSKAISFTPPNLLGLSVSLPIFTSGSRLAKISQAKIGYQQAVNTRDHLGEGLKVDFENSKSIYISAKERYETEKKNFQLARKILDRSSEKYKQGLMSSTDYTQVQNQYLQTQTSYFTAALSLINAKNKIEKILTPADQNSSK